MRKKFTVIITFVIIATLCIPLHFYSVKYFHDHPIEDVQSFEKIQYITEHIDVFKDQIHDMGFDAEIQKGPSINYLILSVANRQYWFEKNLVFIKYYSYYPEDYNYLAGENANANITISFFVSSGKQIASVDLENMDGQRTAWNHYSVEDFSRALPTWGDYLSDDVEIKAIAPTETLQELYNTGIQLQEELEQIYDEVTVNSSL